jgi:hypothetical protein
VILVVHREDLYRSFLFVYNYVVMEVFSFTIKDQQVDMTFRKGFIAYTFEKDGKTYGSKMKLPSRAVMDIFSVAALLITQAYETIESLQ